MKIGGEVTEGSRIGRSIGYPTANITVEDSVALPDGVYAATAEVDGRVYGAMANLGVKPTVITDARRVLELHLLGFSGDLYGKYIEAELIEHIRPERKFPSLADLRNQIGKDKETITGILRKRKCL